MVKLYSCGWYYMIDFIICEDEQILADKYIKEIDKFMMNYDIDYNCHSFSEYDKAWKTLAKKDLNFKIYLLDIVTEKGSGLDAARLIREEYDDWNSMIIIITSHPQYKYAALSKRLMLVDFINKLDNCEQKLKDDLLICMKNYDNRYNSLRYIYKNTVYNIELRHIISVEKEPDSKRCVIETEHDTFYIQGSLNQVLKRLDKRFFRCHRSLAVNINQIKSYSPRTNTIVFKNNTKTSTISRDKKKELFNRVRGLY